MTKLEGAVFPRDLIVTTPKSQMATAAEEARQCLRAGGGQYFRTFRKKPRELEVGSRIFYVEDGYIRGFAVVSDLVEGNMTCDTTGRDWGPGFHALMHANSWEWVEPVPMKGFQGWRYFDASDLTLVGGWQDPKPEVR